MGRARIIADIRRHHGDSRRIISLVGSFASDQGADVEWLVRPDQAHLVPPGHIIGGADRYDVSWSTQIRERLKQHAQNDPGGSFWVFSYDAVVRAEAESLKSANVQVTVRSPAELIAQASRQRRAYQLDPTARAFQSRDGNLTHEEAVELAKSALCRGSHFGPETALNQPSLRLRMAQLDSRANKRMGDRASEALITDVVGTGIREGWLTRFHRVPGKSGTEAVYLSEPPEPASHSRTAETAPAATPNPSLDVPIRIDASKEIGEPLFSPEASSQATLPKKHANRATTFEQELSRARIGSMPESREFVLDAVETALHGNGGAPRNLVALFTTAAGLVQEKATGDGFSSEKNWPIALKCVQRLMLRAGVLVDDQGKSISDQIGSASRRVVSLAPDFRRKCEAFLAEHILSRLGGISYDDDLYYLGLTLYRRGRERAVPPEDLTAKADELLTLMHADGRIEMGTDRIIRVKTPDVGLKQAIDTPTEKAEHIADLTIVSRSQRTAAQS
jgi:hypothetical protein